MKRQVQKSCCRVPQFWLTERHVQIVEVFQNLKISMKLVTVAEPALS